MAKHRMVTRRRVPVGTIDLVDLRDGQIHLLTPDAHAAGLKSTCDYVALCGAVMLRATLTDAGQRYCWRCRSPEFSVPSQRSRAGR
jgi:hypothetical protein